MGDTTAHPTWALRAHAACEWVLWVVTMNALWWVFTLAGAVVFGMAPATIAAATLTRRQLRGEKVRALPEFAAAWRREFLRANGVLLPLILFGSALGATASTSLSLGENGLATASIAAGIVVAAIVHIVVPMYVSYELPLGAYLTTAMRWGAANLPHVFVALAGTVLVVGSSLALPGIIPFLSVGAIVVIDTALGCAFFHANERALAEAP